MIPQEKSEAVVRGLREAFGVTGFEDIETITRGHTSSLVFRIVVQGSPYLLKIILRADDATRHYASMKAAAEASIAPRVWYTSTEDKVSITDFVDARPLSQSEALFRLPASLRALHALPSFGRAPFNTTCTFLIDQTPALDGFLQRFLAANPFPKAGSDEFFARYAELKAVYPWLDREMVSSHNDLFKPDNILFDGVQVWLVDWEAAFLNDRYADLAVAANHVVTHEEEERRYLERYFGAAPTAYQLARFHLMQQLAHLFYAMSFLFLGSAGKPVNWGVAVPEFRDYHRRMWAGEIDLRDNDAKIVYGKVHWERLLRNISQPRYREALAIVADRRSAA